MHAASSLPAKDFPLRLAGRWTRPVLLSLIEKIGFVQVDSIRTVERAHDLILFPATRLTGARIWQRFSNRIAGFSSTGPMMPR
nr:hypothetical protein [Marinicella sp. W31]MDC2877760.1 hypothetical protein [Marinicella sp. W31]